MQVAHVHDIGNINKTDSAVDMYWIKLGEDFHSAINKVLQNNINVYPNPSCGYVNVDFRKNNEIKEFRINDVCGKSVAYNNYNNTDKLFYLNLKEGVYFFTFIKNNGESIVKKVMVL